MNRELGDSKRDVYGAATPQVWAEFFFLLSIHFLNILYSEKLTLMQFN